ncbi:MULTISPECIES: hypothetical protein [Leptolyngbya]|uniref:hypothetical protein n=1 Tax=Leptolyngbya TaxID=47251 RepID=UPI001685F930|nr:hypothetical protein [Leptolyngbya sp. FACHB-1624]MBD1857587.1 hypothetical protein [Leptolyngbya sp. FACHB-1624]
MKPTWFTCNLGAQVIPNQCLIATLDVLAIRNRGSADKTRLRGLKKWLLVRAGGLRL